MWQELQYQLSFSVDGVWRSKMRVYEAPMSPSPGAATSPRVRQNFPETWLWTEMQLGYNVVVYSCMAAVGTGSALSYNYGHYCFPS